MFLKQKSQVTSSLLKTASLRGATSPAPRGSWRRLCLRALYGGVPGTDLFPYFASFSVGLTGALVLFLVRRVRKGTRELVAALAVQDRELRRTVQLVAAKEKAEAELRDALEQTRTLLDQLPVGVSFRLANDTYAEVNDAAADLLEVPVAEMTCWTAADFVRVLNPRQAHDGVRVDPSELPSSKAMTEGAVSSGVEMLIDTPSGSTKHISVDAAPIRSRDGEIRGGVAIFTDVTRERALEDEVRQAQKLEAVGRLAGGVAHDFNNLLAVILNYAQFVVDDAEDGALQLEDVRQIQSAATKAAEVVKQLLAFSRKDAVTLKAVDLNVEVSETMTLLERVLGEHIELQFVAGAALPKVTADVTQLQQVLLNLAVNARNAMPKGGCLKISTTLDAREGRPFIRLLMQDSGCGIAPEVLPNIFEPFFTTKGVGEGTGLGLASVYGIMQRLGGDVAVESVVGRGTTFSLSFPAAVEESDCRAVDPGDGEVAGGRQRVVVVEDEDGVRNVAERLLRRAGFHVSSFASPRHALDYITSKASSFDLLLSDMVMPEMGGVELARQVVELVDVPVLFMTGYSDDILSGYDNLNFQATVLQKPFTRDSMLHSVAEALSATTLGLSSALSE